MKKITSAFLFFAFSALIYGQATVSSLRKDGIILKNGNPYFPMGFYCEGFETLNEHMYAASKMAEGKFDLMYTEYNVLSADEYDDFLDTCSKKGIYNVIGFYDSSEDIDAPMTQFVNTFKNKPSILMWSVCDDANNVSSKDVIRKHNLAKSLDQNHLTYQSWYTYGIDTTVGIVDISAMQSYPIYADGNMDRDWDLFRQVVWKSENKGKASIANLQIYSWSDNFPTENDRWPTAAEADVQSYLAISAGFKGILYYTFKDYNANKTIDITHPELWNACIRVSTEINASLKDALLSGSRISTGTASGSGVYYGKWLYKQEEFIVAVNANKTANAISIPVSGNTKFPLFPYRNNILELNGNSLTGNLGPLEVQIYKITGVPLDTIAPTAPTKLAASSKTTGSFTLSWSPSTDQSGIYAYEVFLNDTLIGRTKSIKYDITDLACGTTYKCQVKAYDFAGNSAISSLLDVKTASCTTGMQNQKIAEGVGSVFVLPNPATSKFTVTQIPRNAVLSVIAMDGMVVCDLAPAGNQVEIDADTWRKGVYILCIKSAHETRLRKLIKN